MYTYMKMWMKMEQIYGCEMCGGKDRMNCIVKACWYGICFVGSHKSDTTKFVLNEYKTITDVIPGILTSVLQPLDVHTWRYANSIIILSQFIINTWSKNSTEAIIRSFKKYGISNVMDDTEDDALWEDDDGEEEEHAVTDIDKMVKSDDDSA